MQLCLTPPSLLGSKFRIDASHGNAASLSVGCLVGLPHSFSFWSPPAGAAVLSQSVG